MTAKEYLLKLRLLDTKISQKLGEILALRNSLTNIPSVNTTEEKVMGGSVSGDARFVNTIAKISELETEVDAEIDSFVDEKHKIINEIQGLENEKHIDILYKKYIEYVIYPNLETIAVTYNKSYRHIKRLHGQALEAFRKKYLN